MSLKEKGRRRFVQSLSDDETKNNSLLRVSPEISRAKNFDDGTRTDGTYLPEDENRNEAVPT